MSNPDVGSQSADAIKMSFIAANSKGTSVGQMSRLPCYIGAGAFSRGWYPDSVRFDLA
jgi:hypothetical protein